MQLTATPLPLGHGADETVEMTYGKRFQFSPDSTKVLFHYVTRVGDTEHGPCYVVNKDGASQQLLLEDFRAAEHQKPSWLNDNQLLYLKPVADDYANCQLMWVKGKDNNAGMLDEEVSFLALQE